MTPKFITPCFVHIENKAYREKVLRDLNELGYACACVGYGNDAIVSTHDADYSVDYRPVQSDTIDCGTNTELFLALAGMRSDTDEGQYFITDQNEWFVSKYDSQYLYPCERTIDNLKIGIRAVRKATPAEIIEHFSQPTV